MRVGVAPDAVRVVLLAAAGVQVQLRQGMAVWQQTVGGEQIPLVEVKKMGDQVARKLPTMWKRAMLRLG